MGEVSVAGCSVVAEGVGVADGCLVGVSDGATSGSDVAVFGSVRVAEISGTSVAGLGTVGV
jgi:hypothetical protein